MFQEAEQSKQNVAVILLQDQNKYIYSIITGNPSLIINIILPESLTSPLVEGFNWQQNCLQ